MRKLLAIWMMGIAGAAGAVTTPAPIDNTVPPCDSSQLTEKPPCNADSESVTIPAPTRDEKGSVIVPPAPVKGLPSQENKPSPDKDGRKPDKP